jgi:diphthamide synthase (EF-2-diphthine--ammonia ligase)
LSNYQRLRIEHVCTRLGLFSLSYLWQQPQLPLLDRMIASGMEVVLVKVAGVGLGVDLVGKSIREVRPLLARLVRGTSFRCWTIPRLACVSRHRDRAGAPLAICW